MTHALTKILGVVPVLWLVGPSVVYAQSNSETRAVAAFTRLVVQDGIDVFLTQAGEQRLRIEVEGYDLDDVVTEVVGGELRLSNSARRGFSFGRGDVEAYIDFVQLSAIKASGGSDIEGRNDFRVDDLAIEASGGSDVVVEVQAQSLAFKLSGGSDLVVRGTTQTVSIQASGGSDVAARGLAAEAATVQVSGGSDASVRASASVVIDASGGSDVSVHGEPAQRTVNNDRSSDVAWR